MFGLSKYYSIIGAICIVLTVTGSTWIFRVIAFDDLQNIAEKNTVILTRTLANVVWPQIAGIVAETDRTNLENRFNKNSHALKLIGTLLGEPIAEMINKTNVYKIKVFNAHGLTVYSTDPSQIGIQKPPDYPGTLANRENKIISFLKHKEKIVTWQGKTLTNRYVVSTYLPLRHFDEYGAQGVFEIYSDVTDLYDQAAESQAQFAVFITLVMTLIYLMLFFVVRRADKAIKANIELAVSRDSARKANQTKSRFLANMSHELRTPLNAIIGYSEIIEENAHETMDSATVNDSLKIQTAARHLLHLINEVLDISKIESGHMEVLIEPVLLRPLIEEITSMVEPVVTRNHNNLKLDTDPSITSFATDPVKLKQIIFNLLSNAAKFTHHGTINLSIRIVESNIEICVSDTGIGISAEQMMGLFKPFTQADSSTTKKYGGTGLGLAITKQYCEMLGGSISVDSQLGRGTTFIVKHPLNLRGKGCPLKSVA